MSGALVGEVLDALEAGLKLRDPEKLILLAIAEKCQKDRRGHVRKGRLVAAVGPLRTTERYLSVLVKAEMLIVVKRGFKIPGQDPQAPLYELPPIMVAEANSRLPEVRKSVLPPPKLAEAQDGASAIQLAEGVSARSEGASARSEGASATPPPLTSDAATVDGTHDGTYDRKEPPRRTSSVARKSAEAPAPQPVAPSSPPRIRATGNELTQEPRMLSAAVQVLRTAFDGETATVRDVAEKIHTQRKPDAGQISDVRDRLEKGIALGTVRRTETILSVRYEALPTTGWTPKRRAS